MTTTDLQKHLNRLEKAFGKKEVQVYLTTLTNEQWMSLGYWQQVRYRVDGTLDEFVEGIKLLPHMVI